MRREAAAEIELRVCAARSRRGSPVGRTRGVGDWGRTAGSEKRTYTYGIFTQARSVAALVEALSAHLRKSVVLQCGIEFQTRLFCPRCHFVDGIATGLHRKMLILLT